MADLSDSTDQIIVQFNTVTQANENASPRAMEALSSALGQQVRLLRMMGAGNAQVLKLNSTMPLPAVEAMTARIERLTGASAEPDVRMSPNMVPNDTRYADQWHYYESLGGINAETAWDTTDGSGVVVAVLDTGYRPHADLAANVLPGYDMIINTSVANDGNGRDADARDPGDAVAADECYTGSPARNSSWHGTHVAGTVAAVTDNGTGVAGVAHGAKILPVRVLGKCGGYSSDITDGMRWAAGLSVSGVPLNPNPAKVLNLSLGGGYSCASNSAYQNAINAVNAVGATVVVSAGNSNTDASNFSPAGCNGVITVASSSRDTGKAPYSNYGPAVEIAAPGGDSQGYILSTLNAGTTNPGADSYAWYQGTSMAAPHVAGVAALMYSQDSSLDSTAVSGIMTQTAKSFSGGSSCNTFGCGSGIVDAAAAVAALGATPVAPAGLQANAAGTDVIALVWTDNADNEDGFVIERSSDAGTNWDPIASVSANVTSYNDSGLAASTTYHYRVLAYSDFGSSGYSNIAFATTLDAPVIPDAPVATASVDTSNGNVTVSWNDVANETGYEVEREKLKVNNGVWQKLTTVGTTAVDVTSITDAPGDGTYHYRVRALGSAGDSGWSAWVQVDVTGTVKGCKRNLCK